MSGTDIKSKKTDAHLKESKQREARGIFSSSTKRGENKALLDHESFRKNSPSTSATSSTASNKPSTSQLEHLDAVVVDSSSDPLNKIFNKARIKNKLSTQIFQKKEKPRAEEPPKNLLKEDIAQSSLKKPIILNVKSLVEKMVAQNRIELLINKIDNLQLKNSPNYEVQLEKEICEYIKDKRRDTDSIETLSHDNYKNLNKAALKKIKQSMELLKVINKISSKTNYVSNRSLLNRLNQLAEIHGNELQNNISFYIKNHIEIQKRKGDIRGYIPICDQEAYHLLDKNKELIQETQKFLSQCKFKENKDLTEKLNDLEKINTQEYRSLIRKEQKFSEGIDKNIHAMNGIVLSLRKEGTVNDDEMNEHYLLRLEQSLPKQAELLQHCMNNRERLINKRLQEDVDNLKEQTIHQFHDIKKHYAEKIQNNPEVSNTTKQSYQSIIRDWSHLLKNALK